MKIAIVIFEGFNEIDSFVALNILNRVTCKDWKAEIVAPTEHVKSMNGVTVYRQKPLAFVQEADAVLFGSGRLTRSIVEDEKLMSVLHLEPSKQLIGSFRGTYPTQAWSSQTNADLHRFNDSRLADCNGSLCIRSTLFCSR